MTGRRPVRDDLAADLQRVNRDLADLVKPGKPRTEVDQVTIDALLDARNRLTELVDGLAVPTETEPATEGPS